MNFSIFFSLNEGIYDQTGYSAGNPPLLPRHPPPLCTDALFFLLRLFTPASASESTCSGPALTFFISQNAAFVFSFCFFFERNPAFVNNKFVFHKKKKSQTNSNKILITQPPHPPTNTSHQPTKMKNGTIKAPLVRLVVTILFSLLL